VAEPQQGLFSARQAIAAGFDRRNHSYHVKRGNWVREAWGLYRLSRFPRSLDTDYSLWSLWSMGDADAPQGVLSHETALAIHGLSDLLPGRIHMSVPKDFSTRELPIPLILHRRDLPATETEPRAGYRVTTPIRTLRDLASTLSPDLLHQALAQALERGLITRALAEAAPELRALLPDVDKRRDAEPLYRLLKTLLKPQGRPPADYDRTLRDMALKLQPMLARLLNWASSGRPVEALKKLLGT
jgi:hypothetical protein